MQRALPFLSNFQTRRGAPLRTWALLAAGLMTAPLLAVALKVLTPGTGDTWAHLLDAVLPDYIRTTLWLCLGVGLSHCQRVHIDLDGLRVRRLRDGFGCR